MSINYNLTTYGASTAANIAAAAAAAYGAAPAYSTAPAAAAAAAAAAPAAAVLGAAPAAAPFRAVPAAATNQGTKRKKRGAATTQDGHKQLKGVNGIGIIRRNPGAVHLTYDEFCIVSRYLLPHEVANAERVCKVWYQYIHMKSGNIWQMQVNLQKIEIEPEIHHIRTALWNYRSKEVEGQMVGVNYSPYTIVTVKTPAAFDQGILTLISEYENRIDYKKCCKYDEPCGKQAWNTHFGDIGEVPKNSSNLCKILKNRCDFFKERTVDITQRLIFIPNMLDGKPLTYRRLIEAFKKKHPEFKSETYWGGDGKDPDDTPFKRSYWIVITRTIVPGSVRLTYDEQQSLISSRNSQYRYPKLVEAVISLLFDTVRQSPVYTPPYKGFFYTRCEELSFDEYPMIAGCCDTNRASRKDLIVIGDFDIENMDTPKKERRSDKIGVVAVRELPTSGGS